MIEAHLSTNTPPKSSIRTDLADDLGHAGSTKMRMIDQEGMSEPPHREVASRMPLGRYLLTAAHGGARRGLLVNRVQHCAEEPPTILVSVRKGHALSPLIRDAATFGLCEVAPSDRILTRLFNRPTELQDEDPFLGHQLVETSCGNSPIPACSASWMMCELLRHLDIEADFEVYIGRILESGLLPAAACRDHESGSRASDHVERPGIDNVPASAGKDNAKRTKGTKRASV